MAEDKNLDYEIKFDDSGFKTAAQEVARRFRMLEKEAESMTSGTTGAVGEFGRDIESYSKLTEEQLDRMIGEFEKARLWMNKVGFRLPIGFPDGTYQFPDSDADIGEELEKVAKVKKPGRSWVRRSGGWRNWNREVPETRGKREASGNGSRIWRARSGPRGEMPEAVTGPEKDI